MLNEERIKLEAQLALFEEGEGKEKLKAASYYKGDFIGLRQVGNLLGLTIGFLFAAALTVVIFYEKILDGLTFERIFRLALITGIVYVILLLLYLILGRIFYGKYHKQAKADVREYYGKLHKLSRLYHEERYRSLGEKTGGRKR